MVFARRVLHILAFMALASCASPLGGSRGAASPDGLAVSEGSREGVVIISAVLPTQFQRVKWSFQQIGEEGDRKERTFLTVDSSGQLRDGDTLIHAMRLPQGEYEIFAFEGFKSNGARLKPERPISVRFDCDGGKVTHVGTLNLSSSMTLSGGSGFKIFVIDRSARVLPVITARHHELEGVEIQSKIMMRLF